MRRKELCAIAGMNPSTFNVHRMNGDLPFDADFKEGTDKAGRAWSEFSIYDATFLIAARQLLAQGVKWAESCEIMRARPLQAGQAGLGHAFFDRPGVFVARVLFGNSVTNEDPQEAPAARVYRGPLADILEAAAGEAIAYSKRRAGKESPINVTGMVAVDLSHCWQLAHQAARTKGINVALPLDPAGLYHDPVKAPDDDGEA